MLVVTTSHRAGRSVQRRARQVARKLSAPLVGPGARVPARAEYRIEQGAEYLLLEGGQRLTPHPGLWLQKRAVGPSHPLLEAVAPSSKPLRVLDGTAGLGQDALHLAAFGHRVLATEAEPVLACLLDGFFHRARASSKPWSEAANRVRPMLADHAELLAIMASASLDVVFFDPMFVRPSKAGPNYAAFRTWTRDTALRRSTLERATRVAAKRVVVKVPSGAQLTLQDGLVRGLGFNRRVATRAFDYWVIEKSGLGDWARPKSYHRRDQQPEPPDALPFSSAGG